MENKKQIGGKRRGAGRKPVLSKKKQISLYVEGAKVVKFGNDENPVSELKNMQNYSVHSIQPQAEVKSSITGLPPKVSLFSEFMAELDNCKTFDEVEKVMKKAKGEAFLPRDRMSLENRAKQVVSEKGLYND